MMGGRFFFARRGAGLSHGAKAVRRGIGAVVFGALALIALQVPARADVIWNFSYNATLDVPYNPLYASNPDGALTASGQLITTALGANKYSITDITGTYNGLAIISLIAAGLYDGNDNLLYPAGFLGGSYSLDGLGLAFMAGGQAVNFYQGPRGSTPPPRTASTRSAITAPSRSARRKWRCRSPRASLCSARLSPLLPGSA